MSVLEIGLVVVLVLVLVAWFFSDRDDDKIIRRLNERVEQSERRERQATWDFGDERDELRREVDRLRNYLGAVLTGDWEFGGPGVVKLGDKEIRRASKKRIRFQRNGATGDVSLSLQKATATENEGGFL